MLFDQGRVGANPAQVTKLFKMSGICSTHWYHDPNCKLCQQTPDWMVDYMESKVCNTEPKPPVISRIERIESIAFWAWINSLNKKGFPKTENDHVMNVFQLYDYWDRDLDKETKRIYLDYGKRDK